MNKLSKIILATFFAITIFSCKKSDDVTPASSSETIVGKWTFGAIGIKTDTKTIEATIADIKKLDEETSIGLGKSSYEFKANGTVISIDDAETETGKYIVDAGNKNLTITSDTKKDANGKPEVSSLEIITLTKTNLIIGAPKITKKNTDGDFISGDDDQDIVNYFFSLLVFTAKGLDPDTELSKAKTMQIIINLKK